MFLGSATPPDASIHVVYPSPPIRFVYDDRPASNTHDIRVVVCLWVSIDVGGGRHVWRIAADVLCGGVLYVGCMGRRSASRDAASDCSRRTVYPNIVDQHSAFEASRQLRCSTRHEGNSRHWPQRFQTDVTVEFVHQFPVHWHARSAVVSLTRRPRNSH